MELIDNLRLSFLYWIDCNFNPTKKLGCDILGWLIKPKTLGHYCAWPFSLAPSFLGSEPYRLPFLSTIRLFSEMPYGEPANGSFHASALKTGTSSNVRPFG
jgi:hypothetical protein